MDSVISFNLTRATIKWGSMIDQYFNRVFLINLDRREDRLKVADAWFQANNIEYERWPAVDGTKLSEEYSHLNDRQKAELGCRASHFQVIQEAKTRNYKSVLVLEDDFEPCADFEEKFVLGILELPADWQLFYLGGNHCMTPGDIGATYLKRIFATSTTHSYAVKNEAFDKVLAVLSQDMQADLGLRMIQQHYPCYCFVPQIMGQRAGYSDIIGYDVNYDFMNDYGK